MAVSHKGAISFGLVNIPVSLYTAVEDSDLHFNQICKEDGSRVKYKKVCSGCGKEVSNKDIVKGFEYEKGKYVTLTDEEFEKAKSEKDKAINILHFTDIDSIDPIYFDKTYYVIPDKGGEKAYELLRSVMLSENKTGIAKTVMGTREKLLAVIPTEKGLMIETLFFFEDIKEIPKEPSKPKISDEEVRMAKKLVSSMVKKFDPKKYKDEYTAKLWAVIQRKIKGKKIVTPPKAAKVNVIDIMEALKQSLEQAGKRK